MSTIAKNIGKDVYYDCVKEEKDIVDQVGETFGKLANGAAMKIVRKMHFLKKKFISTDGRIRETFGGGDSWHMDCELR